MKYAQSVLDLIGNTPLVKLNHVTDGIGATVLAKLEYLNPGGSIKDRIAAKMIEEAERTGKLLPGGTIVEPTSGNTGVGLALVAQQKGYRCIFVVPDKVGEDKRAVLQAYGAEVVVTPTAVPPDSPQSYYGVSDRLVTEIPGAYKPDQFSNPAAPASHYESTGPEIWRDTDGTITHCVIGAGTGGTITGTGRYLKEVSAARAEADGGVVKIIGADPAGSVYSGGTGRPYFVEGVGEDMWPANYDKSVPDDVIAVSDADSFAMTACWSADPPAWPSSPHCRSPRTCPRTPSSWSSCPTPAAATWPRSSTTSGCAPTDSSPAATTPRWGRSSRPRPANCRTSCISTPTRQCATSSTS
jgi:cystathionine beta-synthase